MFELRYDAARGLKQDHLCTCSNSPVWKNVHVFMPSNPIGTPHPRISLLGLNVDSELIFSSNAGADLEAHRQEVGSIASAVAGEEASGHRPAFGVAIRIREFQQIAPFAVRRVARLRCDVQGAANPLRG